MRNRKQRIDEGAPSAGRGPGGGGGAAVLERPRPAANAAAGDAAAVIAWAGWRLPVRASWEPLRIEGDGARGAMVVGDEDRPLLMVQWRRHTEPAWTRESAEAWLRARFRRIGAQPDAGAPRPRSVAQAAWVCDLAAKGGESRTIWCGYAPHASLMLEIMATHLTEASIRREIFESRLPAMRTIGPDEPGEWCIYDVGFMSPPGFTLRQRHLYSGDVALCFRRGRREQLIVRQVYPAALATRRRPLEAWLDASPFIERRRYRAARTQPWRMDGPPRHEGLRRQGLKNLPSPMGWCRSRYGSSLAVTDRGLDRLLIAESLAGAAERADLDVWAVSRMNGHRGAPPGAPRERGARA